MLNALREHATKAGRQPTQGIATASEAMALDPNSRRVRI
jgi:hypothetical protein